MNSADIRSRFLDYFGNRGHAVRPSSSLVPASDPTLLFTNAGMVQFKGAFLGVEALPFARAATSQKCVRAGGKHNDLEEVGRTARHHTFFEMLGNFSFGDYFKEEAISCAWDFLTGEMGLDAERLFVTVHHTDDEAARLWTAVAGVASERIFRLGDRDNFWQMADTGPCGPCSEVHYDLRPPAERGTIPEQDEFERRGEAGEFLELWNLVFMQFDRAASGRQTPLPAPSIDTGLGLERLAAVMQGADSNYHTDLFLPLLDRVGQAVGRPYDPSAEAGVSYRVLADHGRAVAFLIADGVHPSNEGRGYVVRRILRRGVRHAWLLGMREPTLTGVVEAAIDKMEPAYPELGARRESILAHALREEERFLATVDGGMARLAEIAPAGAREGGAGAARSVQASAGRPAGSGLGGARQRAPSRPVIPGREVFKLYDTFGFPLDLTRVAAAERGYRVDEEGFEAALQEQRERSRRAARGGAASGEPGDGTGPFAAERAGAGAGGPRRAAVHGNASRANRFVGYDAMETTATVQAVVERTAGRVVLVLDPNPYYAEGGGQVSDRGEVVAGTGSWRMGVDGIVRDGDVVGVCGSPEGDFDAASAPGSPVQASVDAAGRRDTERNHTATHLLHAALRSVLGGHVRQRGSLVAPDRLRFDFAHTAPLTPAELDAVAERVSADVWASHRVTWSVRPYAEAVAAGAMALFGEKYGDRVRVVEVPGVSAELCGGTHVRRTGEIGAFVVTSESGVAAGVRRIEALTGRAALAHLAGYQHRIERLAHVVKGTPDNVERRVNELRRANAELEALVDELQRKGGDGAEVVAESECDTGAGRLRYRGVRLRARGPQDARKWGDRFRETEGRAVAVVAALMPGDKHALFAFATDAAVAAGVRADAVVREVAARVGGRGGGRPHMAQAGVARPDGIVDAVRAGGDVVARLAGAAPGPEPTAEGGPGRSRES